MSKFYDTCSLLLDANNIFKNKEKFIISSVTLEELEEIKVSSNKDSDIKYAARCVSRELDEHADEYHVHIFKESMLNPIRDRDIPINNDMKILATAIDYQKHDDDIIFVTNDLALKNIAKLFFYSHQITSIKEEDDEYCGYIDKALNDQAMEEFYSYPTNNYFNANINQYIIVRNQ